MGFKRISHYPGSVTVVKTVSSIGEFSFGSPSFRT